MKTRIIILFFAALTMCSYNMKAEKPNENNKVKPTSIIAVQGEEKGYWVWVPQDGDVCCTPHDNSTCAIVVVTPRVAFSNYSPTDLSQAIYGVNNADAVQKVELYLGPKSDDTYVGEISSYSFIQSSNIDGFRINYTLGQWSGPYCGPIDLNTCVQQ